MQTADSQRLTTYKQLPACNTEIFKGAMIGLQNSHNGLT